MQNPPNSPEVQSGFSKSIWPFLRGSKSVSTFWRVPGIASNIPRNKSALIVIGICTTFTCFQTLVPRKHCTIKTSLKSILKWHSRNIYVQNVRVFSCFDLLAKINVNIQDCIVGKQQITFFTAGPKHHICHPFLKISFQRNDYQFKDASLL